MTLRNKVVPKYVYIRIYILNFNRYHICLNNKLFRMYSPLGLYDTVVQYNNLHELSYMPDNLTCVAETCHGIYMKA
jgi:hypothetical protein